MTLTSFLDYLLSLNYSSTNNYGISIILLSLIVNILLIPLFWISEKIQGKERSRQNAMQYDLASVTSIKNKNEKYFYTLEIYKRHNYKTYYSLVGTLGLLVQVPFFLAAYWLLDDYPALTGESFYFIKDLSKPDNALRISWLTINVLPFFMTLINILGILQIRKKVESKQSVQLFITAILFLILLYHSPSSLLLYWTTSNVFSLLKNSYTYKSKPNLPFHYSVRLQIRHILNFLKTNSCEFIFTIRALAIIFLFNHLISQTLHEYQSSKIFLAASIIVLGFGKVIKPIRRFLVHFSIYSLMGIMILISGHLYYSVQLPIFICAYILIATQLPFKLKKQNELKSISGTLKNNLILFFMPTVPALIYMLTNPEYFNMSSGISFLFVLLLFPILLLFSTLYFTSSETISREIVISNVVGLPTAFFLGPIITNLLSSSTSRGAAFYTVLFMLLFVCFLVWMITSHIRILQTLIITTVLSIPAVQYLYNPSIRPSNNGSIAETAYSDGYTSNETLLLKPDIYLLIYDAYTDSEQLQKLYGVENEIHEDFLKKNGFTIIDNIYSLDKHSTGTMSSVLNMSTPTTIQEEQRKLINGESKANQILQNQGYFTLNIVDPYMLRGIKKAQVGYSYPDPSITDKDDGMYQILKLIMIGEFQFNMEYGDHVEWRRILKRQISQDTIAPKFIYAHNPLPGHSQNSGTLLPNETELFEDRLRRANQEMISDINQILSLKRESIIIIAGDHGPYLTADGFFMEKYKDEEVMRDHLLDRFGCFLAIRFPDSLKSKALPKISVLQDVLASVFSTISSDYDYTTLEKSSSQPLNSKLTDPAIINGVINIGSDKGQPLYVRD